MSEDPGVRIDELVAAARAVRDRAYAPYSRFPVGAALLAGGEVFAAPNIENASYPMSVCAERNAVALMVAAGHRHVEAVAVVGSSDDGITSPCGGCRQVLYEFGGPDLIVVAESPAADERVEWRLGELLPEAFGPHGLAG